MEAVKTPGPPEIEGAATSGCRPKAGPTQRKILPWPRFPLASPCPAGWATPAGKSRSAPPAGAAVGGQGARGDFSAGRRPAGRARWGGFPRFSTCRGDSRESIGPRLVSQLFELRALWPLFGGASAVLNFFEKILKNSNPNEKCISDCGRPSKYFFVRKFRWRSVGVRLNSRSGTRPTRPPGLRARSSISTPPRSDSTAVSGPFHSKFPASQNGPQAKKIRGDEFPRKKLTGKPRPHQVITEIVLKIGAGRLVSNFRQLF